MASIHRVKGSSKWHCSFFDAISGKWRLRSTGTEDEKEAEAVCLRFETLSRQTTGATGKIPAEASGELLEAALSIVQTARRGELSEATGRAFVNRILKATGQTEISGNTAREFLANWLAGRKLSRAYKTGEKYQTTVSRFIKSLGKRAEIPLASIGSGDIARFRDSRLKHLSPVTVREDVKILSAAFTVARKQGLIHSNPCEAVDLPKGESVARDTFTFAEVGLLLEAANTEWKTTILLSAYAGMRLGDAVSLKWENIDFVKGLLSYRAAKTKSNIETPMHPALQRHLESLAGDTIGEISPKLARQKIPGRSGLSHQFMQIMRSAGIDAGRIEGHGRRIFSKRSFHSLRHTFVSQMANAGVAPELRQKLAGHSSGGVHRKYTHLELETLRDAIGELPSR